MRGRERASRPLVLIADDAADTREMYALYLNMVGYRVETRPMDVKPHASREYRART